EGRVLGTHIVARPLHAGSLADPVKRLLVAWRERLIPTAGDHVEIKGEPALIELHGIDHPHRGLDAGALQVALKGQRDSLVITRRYEDFEAERRLCRALPQHRPVEIVAGPGQPGQRAAKRRAVAPRAVAYGKSIAAVENIGLYMGREWLEQLAFAIVRGPAVGRQFRSCAISRNSSSKAKEACLV